VECVDRAYQETENVKIVVENSLFLLENFARGVNSIGSSFEDLRGIKDHIKGMYPFILGLMRSV
jgi:hypothetical protein